MNRICPSPMMRMSFLLAAVLLLCIGTAAQTILKPDDGKAMAGIIRSIRQEGYSCTGDPNEKPWRVSETTMDRQGNVIRNVLYGADGSLSQDVVTTYDATGQMTGWKSFNGKS